MEDLRSLRKFDHSLSDLSERIFEILMYQIYDHSFFHADPHAGDIILLPTGQIGLVDFGIAGVFSEEDKRKQLNYLVALSVGDLDQAIDSFVNILEPTDQSNYTEIKQDFRVYLLKWIHANKSESKRTFEKTSGFLIMNSTALVKKYNFKFPKNILLYYKSVFILEHIIFELNPAFDTVAQTSTFLEGNLKRSMQKKISLETSYYRQFNLIENFLNLDKTISNFFNSKDSAPHPKRIVHLHAYKVHQVHILHYLKLLQLLRCSVRRE